MINSSTVICHTCETFGPLGFIKTCTILNIHHHFKVASPNAANWFEIFDTVARVAIHVLLHMLHTYCFLVHYEG